MCDFDSKVKVAAGHSIEANEQAEIQLYPSLTSAADWGELSALRTGRLNPAKIAPIIH
jgi:hypothetical protein